MIDGHNIVESVDHYFEDGSGRVIAFNTISKCSRRWFDFDLTPADEVKTSVLAKERRSLRGDENIVANDNNSAISVLEKTKETMIDPEGCSEWIKDRRENGDFFKQTGTWSTIIVKTEIVSFHIEYKQEQERCSAHSLDMWISSVDPGVAQEQWEGVIGETKAKDHAPAFDHTRMERNNVLKFDEDEAYEVTSPFSINCKGCSKRFIGSVANSTLELEGK